MESHPDRPAALIAMSTGEECAAAVHRGLRKAGVDFAVVLPDSVVRPVDRLLDDDPGVQRYVCSREDEGLAMAVGAYLGGRVPVVMMEGSGVGFCGLVLARAQLQRTPVLMLVGHTRGLGERFDYHGATRLVAEGVLGGLGIAQHVLDDRDTAGELVGHAVTTLLGQKTTVALLIPPYLFEDGA